jgi:hypothetical protein
MATGPCATHNASVMSCQPSPSLARIAKQVAMLLLGGYLLFDTCRPWLRWLVFPAVTQVRLLSGPHHAAVRMLTVPLFFSPG